MNLNALFTLIFRAMSVDHAPAEPPHVPVMLDQVLETLAPRDGGLYVDGTFGAGGYSRAILAAADCRVIAIDRDPDAIAAGRALAEAHAGRLILVEGRFGDMLRLVEEQGIAAVDGVVIDIGVSSMQIDDAARGFSFLRDGPLDMRMSQSGTTAADIVNTLPPEALSNIIYTFGEEPRSRAIARAIVASRSEAPITTTAALVRAVEKAVGRQRPQDRIHPATRTFQALRIHVNGELEELVAALHAAERLLVPGGRLVVVTFHSLEDRIVKRFFASTVPAGCRRPRATCRIPERGLRPASRCPSRATSAPRTARSPAIRARVPPSCAPASAPMRRPCPRSRPRSRFAPTLPTRH